MICPSEFKAPWWLRNNHMQTIWAGKLRRRPRLNMEQKRLTTADDDFIDLVITRDRGGAVVLVLHGLQGSIDSRYASGLLKALSDNGYTAVLMHFRGCSGELNKQPRLYHSGETTDALYVTDYIRRRFGARRIFAIGFSLGGNVLLKLLGEQQTKTPFDAAVAVSVPMRLDLCAIRINQGFSKLYQYLLVKSMKQTVIRKFYAGQLLDSNINIEAVKQSKTFWDFDNAFTAPMHGFKDVHDYYRRCSSRQFLKHIQTPTLILHAADDPFRSKDAIPGDNELSHHVRLEISPNGGHTGFVSGTWPWRMHYWTDQRVMAFLNQYNPG